MLAQAIIIARAVKMRKIQKHYGQHHEVYGCLHRGSFSSLDRCSYRKL